MIRIEDAEKVIVLAQPHRRGSKDQFAECALGRFILRLKLRRELFDAALAYHTLKRKWRSAFDAPRLECVDGTGGDIPMELVNAWAAEIARIELAVAQSEYRLGLGPTGWMLDIDQDPPPALDECVTGALMIIAIELGYLRRNMRPFG